MVKSKLFNTFPILILLLTMFFHSYLQGQEDPRDVVVSAEIDAYKAVEGRPLKGTVSVTHNKQETIDEKSFQLESTPLKVEKIKSVTFSPSSSLEMAIYQFSLPGKPKGLYVLPEISVKVGGLKYSSIPSTYAVMNTSAASQYEERPTTPSTPATLVLKANINGPDPVYPGQKIWLVYQFHYSGKIELDAEQLPLLEARGLTKVGDKRIREFDENGVSVREVAQQAKAISPGLLTFGPSFVEGYAYTENATKQRIYIQPKIRSETPAMNLTIVPFPKTGKPATFNGAVGPFIIEANLLTPAQIGVDEKMKLSITVSGDGDLDTVSMPNLEAAGFRRYFRLSDLPPKVSVKSNIKEFIVEIAPLTSTVKEIPPIPLSYYDPLANHYETVRSDPIPIQVVAPTITPSPSVEVEAPKVEAPTLPPEPIESPIPESIPEAPISTPVEPQIYVPSPIEIKGNVPLEPSDLKNKSFGTWWALWIIPLGILAYILQVLLKRYLQSERERIKPVKSIDMLNEAMALDSSDPLFVHKLDQAFLSKFVEIGAIPSSNIPVATLPSEGIIGEVKNFLNDVEEKRFTGQDLPADIKYQAEKLFKKIPDEGKAK